MKTILLTAVGSMAAAPVLERFKRLGYRVVGCDLYDRTWNAASMEADAFFQAVPATAAHAYLAQMKDAVARYSLDFLIPLTDPEVDALCPYKADFAAMGCALCVPEKSVARLCRAKSAMSQSLAEAGLCPTIPTFDPYAREPLPGEFPIMLKPERGRSSQGQVVARDLAAFRAALPLRADYIAQPYLTGPVWTADVARDGFGAVRVLAREELLRNPSGLGLTVRTVPGHPLEKTCARIAAHAGIVGVVNMEFIEHEGTFYFLEINPRFSGGVGFSMLAGMDFAALTLACHAGERLGEPPAVREIIIARRNEMAVTSPAANATPAAE